MAITYPVVRAILEEHRHKPISGNVLLVGRQTVPFTPDEMLSLLNEEGIPIRDGFSIEIDEQTVGSERQGYITDRCFFSMFADCKVAALDVSDYEGAEIVHDLNDPLPDTITERFDFMFNGSCLDNLFDPACALKNMSSLLRKDGRVLHIEHGSPIQTAYMMYSPALFFDYYAVNQFDDCHVYACLFDNISDPWNIFEWLAYSDTPSGPSPTPHMLDRWQNIVSLVVAQKGAKSTSHKAPIQAFYRGAHGTETDLYYQAFRKFQSSRRLFSFQGKSQNTCQNEPGFRFIGTLEDPKSKSRRIANHAIELARAMRESGRIAQAIEQFTIAIDSDPTIGYAGLIFVERGDMYLIQKKYAEALSDYETALEMNPSEQSYQARRESMQKQLATGRILAG